MASDNGLRNLSNLSGRLALAEHNFGETLAVNAVMVDARESQILDQLVMQLICRLPLRSFRIQPSFAHRFEERAKRLEITSGRIFLISQALTFDSIESRSVELRIVPRLGAPRL